MIPSRSFDCDHILFFKRVETGEQKRVILRIVTGLGWPSTFRSLDTTPGTSSRRSTLRLVSYLPPTDIYLLLGPKIEEVQVSVHLLLYLGFPRPLWRQSWGEKVGNVDQDNTCVRPTLVSNKEFWRRTCSLTERGPLLQYLSAPHHTRTASFSTTSSIFRPLVICTFRQVAVNIRSVEFIFIVTLLK